MTNWKHGLLVESFFGLTFISIGTHSDWSNKFSSLTKLNLGKSNVSFIAMVVIPDTCLLSSVILLNMSASHHSLCMNKCFKTPLCTSYNVLPVESNQTMVQCQLLAANKYSNKKQLEHKIKWTHASIQVKI